MANVLMNETSLGANMCSMKEGVCDSWSTSTFNLTALTTFQSDLPSIKS